MSHGISESLSSVRLYLSLDISPKILSDLTSLKLILAGLRQKVCDISSPIYMSFPSTKRVAMLMMIDLSFILKGILNSGDVLESISYCYTVASSICASICTDSILNFLYCHCQFTLIKVSFLSKLTFGGFTIEISLTASPGIPVLPRTVTGR